jgi:hypothetical protein
LPQALVTALATGLAVATVASAARPASDAERAAMALT